MAFQPSAQTSLDRLARQSATPRTLERFDSTPAFSPLQLPSWPRPQPQKTTTRSSFRRLLRPRLASTRAKLQRASQATPLLKDLHRQFLRSSVVNASIFQLAAVRDSNPPGQGRPWDL